MIDSADYSTAAATLDECTVNLERVQNSVPGGVYDTALMSVTEFPPL